MGHRTHPLHASARYRANMDGMRLRSLVLALVLLWPGVAQADAQWGWSPGVKLGWTFGGYGVTYGIEVSFIRLPDLSLDDDKGLVDNVLSAVGEVITQTWGIVLNLDTDFGDLFKARVGAEWVGPFVGLELGPEYVSDRNGSHFAFGITPWIGYDIYAYYTYSWIFDRSPSLHQAGFYLKTPLLGFEGGNGDGDDDWD